MALPQIDRWYFQPGSMLPVQSSPDAVVLPNHYARFAIEPIRFIADNKLDWFQGNVVKYVCRHDAKNGTEDLKKAKRYLEMYIEFLNENPDWWRAPNDADKETA